MTVSDVPAPSNGGWLDRRFRLSERGSSLPQEVIAGITTFAAMAYIVAVNPAII
jgi:AGZA family xanthine/uracil permease-like MFS transporter